MRLHRRTQPQQVARPASPRARRRGRRSTGQSLVEFSLIFTPMVLLLLALIQFGFIFGGYITMTNAAREAARMGSIYIYDRSLSKDQNDTARNNAARTALTTSFNGLNPNSPNFTSSGTWTKSSLTWTSGDLVVTYVIPSGVADVDNRIGQRITVQATYHLNLFIPYIAQLISKDSGGRLPITTETTMVIN